MKEVINYPGLRAKIIDSPVPEPNDDQVRIQVIVSGANHKDWRAPEAAASGHPAFAWLDHVRDGMNQGEDIAGVVDKVGKNVVEFKPGDRVAALHEMLAPGGAYAEYAIAWSHTTFHIPKHVSFEEAATIPLTGLTAAVALFYHLRLPFPWSSDPVPTPLIIYGGNTAVGTFAIKLAKSSRIHPLIVIAGKGRENIDAILDKSRGDCVINYANGPEQTIHEIQTHLQTTGLQTIHYALDNVVLPDSAQVLRAVVAPNGKVNVVLPTELEYTPGVVSSTWIDGVFGNGQAEDTRDLAFVFSRWFGRELSRGKFSGHPFEVREGGLEGVEQALQDLKNNKARAVKYVFRTAETPGLK